jgi:hypothetical protein
MRGSSWSIMRGVKACETRLRRREWMGGSEVSMLGAMPSPAAGRFGVEDDHEALSRRMAVHSS